MISKENTEIIKNAIMKGAGEIFHYDQTGVRMYVVSGLMDAEVDEIKDLTAFIDWARQHKQTPGWISAQLIHDIEGIRERKECFSPRTAGYHQKVHG